jgi:hypothetical protein
VCGVLLGLRDWEGRYDTYEITVFHPGISRIEKCQSDDPCARGFVNFNFLYFIFYF